MKLDNRIKGGIWISIALALVITVIIIDLNHNTRSCNHVNVEIVDEAKLGFVSDADVIAEMSQFEGGMLGKSLDDINMELFENKLNTNEHINNAEVYSTIDGVVHVKLRQRMPIIRIICRNGEQFYLDDEGTRIPVSENYSAPVLLANGNIPALSTETRSVVAAGNKNKIAGEIYTLAVWLKNNSFWSDMVQQVYVEEDGDLVLITRVGEHKVLLGNATDLDKKFTKLMAFYKGGLNRTGWNLYSDINLKFEDQVVCRKTHN